MKEKYQLCNAGGIFHFIKLFKKHWWSRWEIEWDGNGPRIYMPDILHIGENIPFEKIKQDFIDAMDAMKNELTWEDIKQIVNIADDLLAKESKTEVLEAEFHTEQSYYEEVLKRFKGGKSCGSH